MRSKESDIFLLSRKMSQAPESLGTIGLHTSCAAPATSSAVSPWRLANALLPPVIAIILTLGMLCFCEDAKAASFGNQTPQQPRRNSDDNIRQELHNNAAEIVMLKQRAERLEQLIEDLRGQLDKVQAQGSSDLHENLTRLETTAQHLTGDVRQIKDHSNETAKALSDYRQNLVEMEKLTSVHGDNLRNLEAAVRSLMDLLQNGKVAGMPKGNSKASDEIATADGKTYKVKAGDTLEKIARQNNTTVQELMQRNQLKKGHLIIVGQDIILP